MAKTLKRSVSGIHPEFGQFSYEAGTAASDMDSRVVEYIVNPKAWEDRFTEDDIFGLIPEGMTKEDFIAAAKATAEDLEHSGAGGSGEDDDLKSLTVPELREYAASEGIELGDATKKAEIIETIRNAEGAGNS